MRYAPLAIGIVLAALILAKTVPAAPTARWDYKMIVVPPRPGKNDPNVTLDGETEQQRKDRLARPDPLLVPLLEAANDGWDLVSVADDRIGDVEPGQGYLYFLRRQKP